MPLKNRVLPTGEIVADPARGTLTGNRGCLCDVPGELARRRWTTKAWIACRLDWQGRRRAVMQPRQWTELFFLDEAVALAAGHRPCGYCRRADYAAFRAAWERGVRPAGKVSEIDMVLHAARTGPRDRLPAGEMPHGAFALIGGAPALRWGGGFRRYAPSGYGPRVPPPPEVEALTPAPMRAVLAAGYRPQVHASLEDT